METKTKTFQTIPDQFQVKEPIEHRTYLSNGVLKPWKGKTTPVYSTISSTKEYQPTLLGSIPYMGEEEANEVLESAANAYDKGKGIWPTMKVSQRVAGMEKFAKDRKSTRLNSSHV